MRTKKTNTLGKDLIQMCQILGLVIVNGRFGSDKRTGSFTCINKNKGKSTIDYAVISPVLFDFLTDFVVHDFDELLSDTHCAISLSFQSTTCNQEHLVAHDSFHTSDTQTNADLLFRWKHTSAAVYNASFLDEDISHLNSEFSNLSNAPSSEAMDNFCTKFGDLLINKAKECGIYKVKNSSGKRSIDTT